MIIPLWAILIPWGLFMLVTVLLSLFNLFHLLRYGFFTFSSALFSFLYYGAVIIILFATLSSLGQFDWNTPLFTVGNISLTLPTSI